MSIIKQMQLFKQKTGLGLSLFLMLINQSSAHASNYIYKSKQPDRNQENTSEGTCNQNLIELKALSPQVDHTGKTNSIIVNCSDNPGQVVKLRPFIANRKLPSRRDLELALVEQKAKLADQNEGRLTGQISTFVVNDKTTGQLGSELNKRNASNSSQGRWNRQSNFAFMKKAEQNMLSLGRPQVTTSLTRTEPQQAEFTQISKVNPTQIQTNAPIPQAIKSSILPSQLHLIPNQPSILPSQPAFPNQTADSNDWSSENSGPSALSIAAVCPKQCEQTISSFGTAGPPPFPLNLLPEASLKQLIRSLAARNSQSTAGGPSSTFGSWHSPYALSNTARPNAVNLPYAGFQSHLQQNYSTCEHTKHYKKSLLYASSNGKKTTPRRANPQESGKQIENHVRVASYPAYTTQSLKAWNFAQ